MANKLYDQLQDLFKHGGAAFPFSINNGDDGRIHWPGMTMRNYFAAQALNGLLAGMTSRGDAVRWDAVAAQSYEAADAMLEARKR